MGNPIDGTVNIGALVRDLTAARHDVARVAEASHLATAHCRLEGVLRAAEAAAARGDMRALAALSSEADRVRDTIASASAGAEGRTRDALRLADEVRRLFSEQTRLGRTDVDV